jgi:hypothetical protein
MPKRIEVRANLNFGRFRQGRVYEISTDDDRLMSLLGVGYLEPTSDLEEDYAGWDRSSELGVGINNNLSAVRGDGVAGPSEASRLKVDTSKISGVSDVADSSEQGSDKKLGTRKRSGSRVGVVDESSDRGESSSPAGNA